MTLQVIVGGQYGSEGKGAVAAWLAAEFPVALLAVRVAGPNAGHTVIGRCPPDCQEAHADWTTGNGHPWRLRHVPVAAVSNQRAMLALAPGSEVDPGVLLSEVAALDSAGYAVSGRLMVDPTATVITPGFQAFESGNMNSLGLHPQDSASLAAAFVGPSLVERIGSTGKGIGAARAARALRQANLVRDSVDLTRFHGDVGRTIRDYLAIGGDVQIEGTQGYLLGQHAGFYPHCTSSDCTATDFLAMAGCPPWLTQNLEVWVVFRAFPIRVAGNSGPLMGETTWDELGLPVEYTTVTRKPRRVGAWDGQLARQAMQANGHSTGHLVVRAALTMADHVIPELAGRTDLYGLEPDHADQLDQLISMISHDLGRAVDLIGTGPVSILDLRRPLYREARPKLAVPMEPLPMQMMT